MKTHEDLINGLKKEIKIPQSVSTRFDSALSQLPETSNGTEYKKDKRKMKVWARMLASAAAVLVLVASICIANPVLASKIPIIGKIFARVEDKVTYSGNYADKAQELATDEDDEVKEALDSQYTVTDQGVQLTASEVYCDGYSVFITAQVTVEAGGLNNMYKGFESETAGTEAQSMYIGQNAQLQAANLPEETPGMSQLMEGEVIDDHNFVGIIKVDLNDLERMTDTDGVLDLQISMLGYDAIGEENAESIGMSHEFNGNWNLSIPYTVDTKSSQVIEVNQKTDHGLGVQKIFISPYQALVYLDVPYTELKEDDVDELGGEETEGLVAAGEEAVTFTDVQNQKKWEDFEVVAFNQDNQELEWHEAGLVDGVWVAQFSVRGLEVSKLQIFMNQEWLSLIKAESFEDVKEKAVWSTEVDVK